MIDYHVSQEKKNHNQPVAGKSYNDYKSNGKI